MGEGVFALAQPLDGPMNLLDAALLSRTSPFCRLDVDQRHAALGLAHTKSVEAGAVAFDEGQPARRFYMILSGHIRMARITESGDMTIVLHIPPGQVFGFETNGLEPTHQTSAIAVRACRVLSWSNDLWPMFSNKYQGFAAEMFRCLNARADEMSNRIVEMQTKMAEQRIACALLRMIGQSGRKVASGVEIDFPISRQNIADMTGTTLHTVSRLLSAWEKQGLIEGTRCHIIVKEPHRMVMIASAARIPATARPCPAELQTAYSGCGDNTAPNSARKLSSCN